MVTHTDDVLAAWEKAMRWWWDGMSDVTPTEALASEAAMQRIHETLRQADDEAELRSLYSHLPPEAEKVLTILSDEVSDPSRVRDAAFWVRYFELRDQTSPSTSTH